MAVWHFTIAFIPASFFEKRELPLPTVLSEFVDRPIEELDSEKAMTNYWNEVDVRSYTDEVAAAVGPITSVSIGSVSCGDEESGDYAEIFDDDLFVHFDLRYLKPELIDWVISFAERHNLLIAVFGTGSLIQAEVSLLEGELLSSRAAEYVRDPEGTLKKHFVSDVRD